MKYNFSTHKTITDSIWYYVNIESKQYSVLGNMTSYDWTSQKVQLIIDKVESNRNLEDSKDPYVWGNEDVTVFANEIGVLLIDKMALRAGQDVTPLELPHDDFITFLKDFKKFIEENS